jgi:hypothetical protein
MWFSIHIRVGQVNYIIYLRLCIRLYLRIVQLGLYLSHVLLQLPYSSNDFCGFGGLWRVL